MSRVEDAILAAKRSKTYTEEQIKLFKQFAKDFGIPALSQIADKLVEHEFDRFEEDSSGFVLNWLDGPEPDVKELRCYLQFAFENEALLIASGYEEFNVSPRFRDIATRVFGHFPLKTEKLENYKTFLSLFTARVVDDPTAPKPANAPRPAKKRANTEGSARPTKKAAAGSQRAISVRPSSDAPAENTTQEREDIFPESAYIIKPPDVSF